MTKSKISSSMTSTKKRDKDEALEEKKSNQFCGACGQPLYGGQDEDEFKCIDTTTRNGGRSDTTNASGNSVSKYETKEEHKMSNSSNLDDTSNILSSDNTATARSRMEVARQNIILTCSNMSGQVKCCRSAKSNGFSPRYHFGCIQKIIPQRSKMYRDICNYVQEVEEVNTCKKIKVENMTSYPVKLQQKESVNPLQSLRRMDKMLPRDGSQITLPDKVPLDKFGRHSSDMNSSNENSGPSTVGMTKRLPKNPFLCEMCDIQGSSQYLSEYFVNFRKLKQQFYGDDEAVDAIHPISFSSLPNGDDKVDDELMVQDTGFVKYLMEKDQELNPQVSYKPTELTAARIHHILQCTSKNMEQTKSSTIVGNSRPITPYSLIGQPIRLFCNVSNSYHTGRIIDARDTESIDTSRMKSSTIQKYMRKKSTSKSSSKIKKQNYSSPVKLDRDIASTQYLVRFRARIDGRKSAVHQWLYLEEHPLMVGVNIVWAKLQEDNHQTSNDDASKVFPMSQSCSDECLPVKCGDLSSVAEIAESDIVKLRRLKRSRAKFYPGQIFLRTALEMMHIDDINPSLGTFPPSKVHASCGNSLENVRSLQSNVLNVIVLIFYSSYKCVCLNLGSEIGLMTCDTQDKNVSNYYERSRTVCAAKQGEKSDIAYTVSVLEQPFDHLPVADFLCPPPDLKEYLEVLKAYDECLVHAIVSACCEEEEQRRLVQWHAMKSSEK